MFHGVFENAFGLDCFESNNIMKTHVTKKARQAKKKGKIILVFVLEEKSFTCSKGRTVISKLCYFFKILIKTEKIEIA